MNVTLFMATSVNGYIARENGEEDFLSHVNWQSFEEKVNEFKNFIIGRKTYEAVQKWTDGYGFDDFDFATKVILTANSDFSAPDGYLTASSPAKALEILQSKGFERVLVTGGSKVNSAFAKAGLLNEIILNLEPVAVGKGIPLFSPADFDLQLSLKDKQFFKGIVQLTYAVSSGS